MCRFLVYKGSDEILLANLVLDPVHSILKQSFDSRLRLDRRRGVNNADGFGIGYYTPRLRASPFFYTSVFPAWNDENLERLAYHNASPLIFAHVRATTEGSTSQANCHPFVHGSLMWMHNGGLGGWKQIKRRLAERLADKWYLGVKGGTDSEWAFALFLDTLERMGVNPSCEPADGFDAVILKKAMLKTIEIINELTDQIPESVVYNENVDTKSLMNFCVSDGHSIVCTRYINSSTDEAASLYYSTGTQWENRHNPEDNDNYQMERRDRGADVVLIASEPLTFQRENWINVPTNTILTIHDQSAFVEDIKDRFYHSDPWHRRSAGYVHSKGLVANEKTATPSALLSPAVVLTDSNQDLEDKRAHLGPTIPFSLMRSVTPQIQRTTSSEMTGSPAAVPRTRATVSGGSILGNADVRSVRIASDPRSAPPSNLPPQGNIKKKRMSLGDMPHMQGQSIAETDPPTPLSPIERAAYGDPAKIARFFPELS
ncbi:nucleophile aminohydrolase [Coniella lustricola]|uniref:Nucleophile aminohydrolase n=1 Tax=Coniella lustricola TaxID=2025994 RepID=A0A2T3A1L6_9PEZI|nr:nucleophile aminohydrolase [Coniella lustricola]